MTDNVNDTLIAATDDNDDSHDEKEDNGQGGYWDNILIKHSRQESFKSTRSQARPSQVIMLWEEGNSMLAVHVDMCKRYRTGLLR